MCDDFKRGVKIEGPVVQLEKAISGLVYDQRPVLPQ